MAPTTSGSISYNLQALRDRDKRSTMTYTNELHEALITKDGPSFWKCWRSKFELHKNVVRLKVVLMMKSLLEILPNISQRSTGCSISRMNMRVLLYDLDDPMTHPSCPLFQFWGIFHCDLGQGHIPEERRSRSVKSVQFCPGHVSAEFFHQFRGQVSVSYMTETTQYFWCIGVMMNHHNLWPLTDPDSALCRAI